MTVAYILAAAELIVTFIAFYVLFLLLLATLGLWGRGR